ncbi:hypothetical protein L2E82_29288 [Cichorium intybus]|uniref:Uncharacterized protein n=1 Tax=Cichorium intybus TaxID=13427 RepID=A0ACB9CXR2_CICIN|nr:hypothetical protein L2E82_29288 [Cichorium intybus]
MVKIQPMAGVEEKVVRGLGWTELAFLNERCLGTYSSFRGAETSQIQMYYEFDLKKVKCGLEPSPQGNPSYLVNYAREHKVRDN